MQKFFFSLETVLKDRARKEQEAAVTQARAQKLLQKTMDTLSKTTAALESTFKTSQSQKVDPVESLNLVFYREVLLQRQSQQEIEVNKASNKVELCRQKTVEARMNKLVIEKLKENKLQEYHRELALEQQKIADEQGIQSFMRRNIY